MEGLITVFKGLPGWLTSIFQMLALASAILLLLAFFMGTVAAIKILKRRQDDIVSVEFWKFKIEFKNASAKTLQD